MMEKKLVRDYIENSFGFPVQIEVVSFFAYENDWIADIDYQRLKKTVLEKLAVCRTRLDKQQLNFIRLCSKYKIIDFWGWFKKSRFWVTRGWPNLPTLKWVKDLLLPN